MKTILITDEATHNTSLNLVYSVGSDNFYNINIQMFRRYQ